MSAKNYVSEKWYFARRILTYFSVHCPWDMLISISAHAQKKKNTKRKGYF